MSWEVGNQLPQKPKYISNKELLEIKGQLDEDEAKILLYQFLRNNITFSTELLTGVELFPFQHIAIKSMLECDYSLAVWSRGLSKSFSAGLFAILDAVFNQGVEIGILANSFRQARQIFNKIEEIARKPGAVFLNQCITKVRKNNDEWVMEIGESRVRALPLGDGEKLRGFRFQRLLIDEFLLMPEKIYNEIIVPFLSVIQNPIERQRMHDMETRMIEAGKMKKEDRYIWPNNKLIALSSASFKFQYLYKLYEKYEQLIFNPKPEETVKRCIIHLSYDCAPSKLYDQNLIDQARSTMSESQFAREFGTVFTDESDGYFKMSKMIACTVPDGGSPAVEVQGDPDCEYILGVDPSWAESEVSDDFAIQVLKLNREKKSVTLVHSYALPGTALKEHINYLLYLIENFNVVWICLDYMGGVQFLNACNESSAFKMKSIKIDTINTDFDNPENFNADLVATKNLYNKSLRRIAFLRKPTSSWIRFANEMLQGCFDHKSVLFASRATDSHYKSQVSKKIPIEGLKFSNIADIESKVSRGARMIDFVEHQSDMIDLTKSECALIVPSTSAQGSQTFDLPGNLKRQKGADKARKDSYSALLLANWGARIYFDMLSAETKVTQETFQPCFIK
jgi:hypothetical protein